MVVQNTLQEHYFVWPGSHGGSGGVFAELRSHMPLFNKRYMRLWFGRCASGIVVGLWLSRMVFLYCVLYSNTTIVKFYSWNIGLLSLRKPLNDCCCKISDFFLLICEHRSNILLKRCCQASRE